MYPDRARFMHGQRVSVSSARSSRSSPPAIRSTSRVFAEEQTGMPGPQALPAAPLRRYA
jgi:hypothetical protein